MFLETMVVIGTLKAQAMFFEVTAKKGVTIQWNNDQASDL
jgi:hypothetical protein